MTDRNRDDTGQFTSDNVYQASDFLAAVDELAHPTTTDIANRVGCSNDTANRWLHQLADSGKVTKTQIGNANVWSRP